jgi:hypothetical protein
MLSKKASCDQSHGQDSPYFLGWQEYEKNSYHEVQNSTGIIQMGLAENQVRELNNSVFLFILFFLSFKVLRIYDFKTCNLKN